MLNTAYCYCALIAAINRSQARRQSNQLAEKWGIEDLSLLGGQPGPQYSVKLPGVFSNNIVCFPFLK
jgi:hypothetical protein